MGKSSKAEGPRFPQTLEQRTFPGARISEEVAFTFAQPGILEKYEY